MNKKYLMNRRHCLRGLYGAVVGLPLLECMLNGNGVALAQGMALPKYFVATFGGVATNQDGRDPVRDNLCVPMNASQNVLYGENYSIAGSGGLVPFEEFSVKNDISVISNSYIPWGPSATNGAGDETQLFHSKAVQINTGGQMNRSTSAWYVARERMSNPGIEMMWDVNLKGSYQPGTTTGFHSSYKNGSKIPLVQDITKMYDSVFGGFSFPDESGGNSSPNPPTQVDNSVAIAALSRRKSVLDFVYEDFQKTRRWISSTDKMKLEEHAESIRGVEKQIASHLAQLETGGEGNGGNPNSGFKECADPGKKSQPNDAYNGNYNGEFSIDANGTFRGSRAEIINTLITQAIACDRSRVVFLQIQAPKSRMNGDPFGSNILDIHEITHGDGGHSAMRNIIQASTRTYADLVSKLKTAGVLDHCAVPFAFDGGYGRTHEGGGAEKKAHSTENMVSFIAGGKALGLKPGIHIDAQRRHSALVWTTAMRAVGLDTSLGQISGHYESLIS